MIEVRSTLSAAGFDESGTGDWGILPILMGWGGISRTM